jgi:6-phosphogluconate dehydrogenase
MPAAASQNFALNMASKGFSVSVCNRSHDKVCELLDCPI